MPVFDTERQCLVVRVVFDGPAFAGKTTNLKQVTQFFPVERRGEMYTPGALKGRTMFFDWLEVEAGRVGGHPLRCQLLTVPGQGERSYRRRPLLESADGVVFVFDSTRDALAETRKTYSQLKAALRRRQPRHIPVVLQANKQDAPDSLSPEEIAHVLRLDPSIAVVPAIAHEGAGVRETVVTAIKVAVREVQQFVAQEGLESILGAPETADQLFDSLLALEDDESLQIGLTEIETDEELIAAEQTDHGDHGEHGEHGEHLGAASEEHAEQAAG